MASSERGTDPPRVGQLLGALRAPLVFAAREGFAHLDKVRDLGPTLRKAADRALGAGGRRAPAELAPLRAWRQALEGFDAAGRTDREILVARGLRIVAALGGAAAPAPAAAVAPVPSQKPRPSGSPADSVSVLPGCGPKLAALLGERGIATVGDLVGLLPRRYQDLRRVRPIATLDSAGEGELVVVRGRVVRARAVPGRFVELLVEAEEPGADGRRARLLCRWFHVHGGLARRFAPGQTVVLAGPVRRWRGEPQMAHPDLLGDGPAGIRPLYPEIEGVPPRLLGKLVRAALDRYADALPESLPGPLRARLGLPGLAEALRLLHAPPGDLDAAPLAALCEHRSPAHRRLAFEEFLLLELALLGRRGAARREPGLSLGADPERALAGLREVLPFRLTGAQERAIAEIARDLAGPAPMMRLLQGDVGAGKTAVAFAAVHLALCAGAQAAIMAPTELLAEQHLRTLEPWARALGWRVALLSASTPRGARESLLALVASGEVQLLLGTHALLAERLEFFRLGLCVVDEQHRFGVAQRARLREKGAPGGAAPHLLVMTATPIPRTLALTAYGDLDLTVLDELPPGRRAPETRTFVGPRARRRAQARVVRAIAAGGQAYVVCPLVEESEKVDLADAVSTAEELRAAFPALRIGLVHGRLAAAERDEVMRRLRAREIDLLVATTVIEVGLDVPDARVMVVEHAERFGLAQLHQLRGRVGRAPGAQAECLLLTPRPGGALAAARLRAMSTMSDGFRIAEADLALRGFGELYGTRQAGLPRLRYGDLARDLELLAEARREAEILLAEDPDLAAPENAGLRAALAARAAERVYGEEAG